MAYNKKMDYDFICPCCGEHLVPFDVVYVYDASSAIKGCDFCLSKDKKSDSVSMTVDTYREAFSIR